VIARHGQPMSCGCVDLAVHTLKDRTGPTRNWNIQFWGERFYPALDEERDKHNMTIFHSASEKAKVA